MSKTIDEKIVEMKFDNKNFETNVQTSLSTLDRLKQKLNLTGASKGLENIQKASKNVDMSGMSNALSTVQAKFSALEVVGVTALANITNSAVNAGKRIVKALTIDPVSSGWKEYELTMNTIQTIVNSTGKSVKEIEGKLKVLDDYADQTVYSTEDMFNNIYKFTNAGIDLDTATKAMIGIANATADAGQGAQQASIAYYNLAQSLSTGYLTTIDYKSLNLANIVTKDLKQQLADTAVQMGTLKKVGDNLYSTGKKSYNLQQLFSEALSDQWATTDVMMKVFGDYANAETEIGKRAYKAATEVKTFSGMMESLKASAGTGWKETWQIVFGGLDEAKAFWSGLNDFIGNIIKGMSELRNAILRNAFTKSFKGLVDNIQGMTAPLKKSADAISTITKTAADYNKVVDEIIMGKYKNAPERYQLLTEAGYDWAHAQNLVNERLGSSVRHATNYKEAQEGVQKTQEQTTKATSEFLLEISKLSDAELKAKGYNDLQIQSLRELMKACDKTGLSLEFLLEHIDEVNGRWLLINSFKNIGAMLVSVFGSIGKAWREVFTGDAAEGLFNIIAGFHKLTQIMKTKVEKNADSLTRTLRGLFSIIHIITTIVGGGFKLAFKLLTTVLEHFNLNIFDLTAIIADAIYNFDRWITQNNVLIDIIKILGSAIATTVSAVAKWIRENEKIQSIVQNIKNAFNGVGESIKTWVEGLKETDNIPKYIFEGLINGLKNGAGKVFSVLGNLVTGFIELVKGLLGIHSPSTVFFAIGGFIIAGLVAGLISNSGNLWGALSDIGNRMIDFFKNLKIGDVISVAISAGIILTINKLLKIIQSIVSPLQGLNNVFNSVSSMLLDFGNAAENFGKRMKYEGVAAIIKSVAISIGVLVAALVVLGKLPFDQLKQGGIALGIIVGVLALFTGALALMANRLSKVKLPDMGKTLAVVIGTAVGINIMASALKKIGKIPADQIWSAVGGLIVCTAAMVALIAAMALVTEKLKGTKNIQKLGNVFLKIGATMLIMATALKMMKNVNSQQIWTMVGIFVGIGALLGAIAAINTFSKGAVLKAGETIKSVGTAILLLVIAMKLSGMLKKEDFINGIGVITVFLGFISALMLISKIFKGTEMIKVSGSILLIVTALAGIALVMKLLAKMDPGAIKKGFICITGLSVIVGALIAISKGSASLHGTTLVGVAATILALAAATVLLGLMDPDKIKNGILAVGALSIFVALLIKAANGFTAGDNIKSTLVTLAVIITLLATAMIALSFIDPTKLLSSASSLGIVMLSLSAVVAAVGHMKIPKKAISTLLLLTGVIGVLAGIISLMSMLPNPQSAVGSAAGIAILLGAMSAVALALNKFDQRKKVNIKGIAQLGAILIIVAGLGATLAMMGDTQNAVQNALALTILMAAMTGVLAALGLIANLQISNLAIGLVGLLAIIGELFLVVMVLKQMDGLQNVMTNVLGLTILTSALTVVLLGIAAVGAIYAATMGIAATGLLGMLALIGELFLVVELLRQMQDIQNVMPNVTALTLLLGALTDCLFKISIVGPLALIADAAIFGLIGAITTMGVLATAVGALMDKFPQLQAFLDKGLPVLEQIALSIGKVLGNLVGGFLDGATQGLPELGLRLSQFMVNALPFITIAQSINDRLGAGVKYLSGALFSLIGANLLDTIAKFISNGESFSRLGTELSNFANNAQPFITIMSGVNPNVMAGAKSMADAILSLTAGNLLQSITGWLTGNKDLSAFGSQLGTLGTGLSQFVANLNGFSEDKVSVVNCACEALKTLSDAAGEIPPTGGLFQVFGGETDIESFGKKLPAVAEGITKFVKTLVEGGFSDDKINIVKAACEALKALAEVAKAVPAEDGFWQWLSGKQDLESFASKFPKVAEGIMGFVNGLKEFPENAVDRVNAACNVMWAIKDLAGIDLNNLSSNVEQLGARLVSFAGKLGEFGGKMNDVSVESLESAKSKLQQIIEIANNMASVNSESLEKFSESLSKFGRESIQNFVNALNDAKPKSDAEEAIKNIINAVLNAIESKKSEVEEKCRNLVQAAADALKDGSAVSKAEEAGKNFSQGFANGINNHRYLATNAGSSLGNAAYEAARKSIDSHSPSKKTYKLGTYFDQGFVNGIKALRNKVYDASSDVGERAKTGLSRAISKVADMMNSDMDMQPTIRPVLDLSDVKSGVGNINSMFTNPSFAVASNLGAISVGMARNRQNGNDDVVSAINKLGKSLSGARGNTYNVNGITYDDGSEISNAVSELVRAARVERRV